MVLFKTRRTKALISLRVCAGWSRPLLFANPGRQVFSLRGPYITLDLFFVLVLFLLKHSVFTIYWFISAASCIRPRSEIGVERCGGCWSATTTGTKWHSGIRRKWWVSHSLVSQLNAPIATKVVCFSFKKPLWQTVGTQIRLLL